MPILNPESFIKPCPTNGQCGNLRKKALGIASPTDWSGRGQSYVAFGSEEVLASGKFDKVTFVCCTDSDCNLPISLAESIRLNDLIGLELPTIKDTLSKLKAMKERLKQNEGRTR